MSDTDYRRWVCDACGFIYDEARGDPDSGLQPGTRYEQIPDDWQCPLCGLSKGDLRLLPDAAATSATRKRPPAVREAAGKGSENHVVIIGAGIAGWSVAEAIRAADGDTPIMLVSACAGISYPKPALSTALASGKRADQLAEQDGADKAAGLDIELRTQTRVLKIDPARKRITTARGGIRYGRLVLALGSAQRELQVQGDAAADVLRVNDLAAYARLRERLDQGARHVTVLGAGLIGCEFAEDLRGAGYGVRVIDPGDYPLASLLPSDSGQMLRRALQEKGVQWHFQTTLDSLEHGGKRLRATLSDGEAFETDLVLSAAGLVPHTQLAHKAGLAVGGGIITDRLMQTSQADVYALGDCASVEGQVFAYIEPIRRQAQTIAATLRGESLPFLPKPPLVRVKTPSFPLVICPPRSGEQATMRGAPDHQRIDYLQDDNTVGFVLSGAQAGYGMSLYRELYG